VDAALRPLAERAPGHLRVVARSGHRLPRLARAPDRRGERLAGVWAVQAERIRQRFRPVGSAGARGLRRPDRRADLLSRHRPGLSALRPPAPARGVAPNPGRRTRSDPAERAMHGATEASDPVAAPRAGAARADR